MRHRSVFVALPVALLVCLAGCGGNENHNTLLYEETQELLEGLIDNLKKDAESLSADDAIKKAADFLRNSSLVKDVYSDENSGEPGIHAEFINGIHLVIPVVEVEGSNNPLADPTKRKGGGSHSSIKSELGMVKGAAAFLDLAKDLPLVAQRYQNIAAAYGFTPEDCIYGGPADPIYGGVEFFRNLHDYSLIYFSTHGQYLTTATSPVETFVFMTNQVRNQTYDEMYWQDGDFQNARILLGLTVIRRKLQLEMVSDNVNYFLSARFINEYCGKFDDYSLVFADACRSAHGTGKGRSSSLIDALLDKSAGAVLGWTWAVYVKPSQRAADYLFDRLFGHNQFEPRTPPIRPYGILEAYEGLVEKEYHLDPHSNFTAELILKPDEYTLWDHNVLLRPSLWNIDTDWMEGILVDKQKIVLWGEFGEKQGEVCIGDFCTGIEEGEYPLDNVIYASCPPNTYGPVTVNIDGHISNAAPLSMWQGSFRVSGEVDLLEGPTVDALMEFGFRADIHKRRDGAEDEIGPQTGASIANFEIDGSCEIAFSGEYNVGDQWLYQYTGEHTVLVSEQAGDGTQFLGSVSLEPENNQAVFSVSCAAPITRTVIDLETMEANTSEYLVAVHGTVSANMIDYGIIETGEDHIDVNLRTDKVLLVEWNTIAPLFPPNENTPG